MSLPLECLRTGVERSCTPFCLQACSKQCTLVPADYWSSSTTVLCISFLTSSSADPTFSQIAVLAHVIFFDTCQECICTCSYHCITVLHVNSLQIACLFLPTITVPLPKGPGKGYRQKTRSSLYRPELIHKHSVECFPLVLRFSFSPKALTT